MSTIFAQKIMLTTLKLFLLGIVSSACFLSAQECVTLSDTVRGNVQSYLTKKLHLRPDADLKIVHEELVPSTCYRKLTLQTVALKHPIVFYLSPDQQFGSASLFNLKKNPDDELTEEYQRVHQLLTSEPSPSQGATTAPVTVVEFSDFECSYCKRFDSWIKALPTGTKQQIRVVYKALPLSIHPWAKDAALNAMCANQQSSAAFWKLNDVFFSEQSKLNSSVIMQSAIEALNGDSQTNIETFKTCVTLRSSEDVVKRDIALANALNIHSTPTIFLNGQRIGPLLSIGDLIESINNVLSQKSGSQDKGLNSRNP